ncbi:MAG TPA: hypothetical protein VG308_00880 [Stellaceae bacterium]|nr:hypothetical protein [Stellaceae bacterium]
MIRPANLLLLGALLLLAHVTAAAADGQPAPDPLTTLACRDREDPGMAATLVFDLARARLVHSAGSGPTILFDDRDVPVHVGVATIEWEVAHNDYKLNRTTLELDVAGKVYVCQLAKKQI